MGIVHTLTGPIEATDLGPVLPHEHLPMNFQAQDDDEFNQGSQAIVSRWYREIFDDLEETPFHTLVDCSAIGHGRDIAFKRRLVGDRDIHAVLSTGFYLTDKQPPWALEKKADECADLLVEEIQNGIGGSDVRAGIIKLAPDTTSEQSRKVCRAGAMASLRTGARITTHSVRTNREHFDMLRGFGVPPERIYIGHADFAEFEENAYICAEGGNVLFTVWDIDYMIPDNLMYRRFMELAEAGHVDRILMSIDFAMAVHDGRKPNFLSWMLYGIETRTHSYLHRNVIPKMQETFGLNDDDLRKITVDNPRRMLDFRGGDE